MYFIAKNSANRAQKNGLWIKSTDILFCMLLDLFFPKTCLSCKKVGRYVCSDCQSSFEYITKDPCIVCDRINTGGLIHENCKEIGGIDGSLSIFYYNKPIKMIIRNIKYKLVRNACQEFFASIPNSFVEKFMLFKELFPECYLQPIPLHSKRYKERGFNQADIIVDWLEELTQFKPISVLKRVRYTLPQARTKSKFERMKNTKNAFEVINATVVLGKNIILVDDVFTTGNTAKAAAKKLKIAGAENVFIFSVAHG